MDTLNNQPRMRLSRPACLCTARRAHAPAPLRRARLPPRQVATQFALADKRTKDGQLDLDEFARFYGKVMTPPGGRWAHGGRAWLGRRRLLPSCVRVSNPRPPASTPPPQVTAPKLLDALSAELPGEVARAREVFLAYASFGAPRGAARAEELDGVSAGGDEMGRDWGTGCACVAPACWPTCTPPFLSKPLPTPPPAPP